MKKMRRLQAAASRPMTGLSFTAPMQINVTAAAAGGEQKLPTFDITAYTGGEMRIWGWGRVVVDLAGMKAERQSRPVLREHDVKCPVGHTTKIEVSKSDIIASGVLSCENEFGSEIIKAAKNGFPWQASCGWSAGSVEEVKAGTKVNVNGREFVGPITVIRNSALGEISIVVLGADDNTSVTVAAQNKEFQMEFIAWLKANGHDPDKLTDEERTTLKAQYDAEQAAPPATPPVVPAPVKPADPPAPVQAKAPAPGTPEPDPIAGYRVRASAEVLRIEAIHKLCGGKHADIEAKAIAEGWSEKETRAEVTLANRPPAPAVQVGQNINVPSVLEAAALMSVLPTSRMEKLFAAQVLDAAHKFRGIGIQELGELACGQRLPRFTRNAEDWLRAAFSTVSLSGILANVANKMLLEGFLYVDDSWRQVCRIASVNDFKQHTRYRMTGSFKFLKVGADGELKHGTLSEQTFTQQADTHGIMFALTRQMIINDDMGALADIPRQIGMGAAEAIADAVWTLLLSNPTLADTFAFFSTDHTNYASGAGSALSVDGLTAAEVLFADQTKPNGKPLGIVPSLLLVPTALKVVAQQLYKDAIVNETTTANKAKPNSNPHQGKFSVVSSPYLSNSGFTGYSSTAWYLFADPNRLPALEVGFLNGVDRPTVERADADFNTLGVQFRGYIDFGVKEQDYRGAVKMAGV